MTIPGHVDEVRHATIRFATRGEGEIEEYCPSARVE
jgi:hypothetical protein